MSLWWNHSITLENISFQIQRNSTVNLRCDGDEKHVAGLEYDITTVAHPDTAGERHEKDGTRGYS